MSHHLGLALRPQFCIRGQEDSRLAHQKAQGILRIYEPVLSSLLCTVVIHVTGKPVYRAEHLS